MGQPLWPKTRRNEERSCGYLEGNAQQQAQRSSGECTFVVSEDQVEASVTEGHCTRRMAANEAGRITSAGPLQAIIRTLTFILKNGKLEDFPAEE